MNLYTKNNVKIRCQYLYFILLILLSSFAKGVMSLLTNCRATMIMLSKELKEKSVVDHVLVNEKPKLSLNQTEGKAPHPVNMVLKMMENLVPETPAEINETVTLFCNEIVSNCKPIFLDVCNDVSLEPCQCFFNVETYIASNGGSIQYGWAIYWIPDLFIEAEFHAVWKSYNGSFTDVTPRTDGEKKILFLPDDYMLFEGVPIENIRKVLKDNAFTRVLLKSAKLDFELKKKYHNGRYAHIPLDEKIKADKRKIEFWREEYLKGENIPEEIKKLLYISSPMMISQGNIPRNSLCPCGSGIKYKKCCGK